MASTLKVGLLSTYNTKCGISEYSRYLVNAFRKRSDINIHVFGSKNYDEYAVAPNDSYVTPTFAVLPWNSYGDHSFDSQRILDASLDVLHVQYECVLYNQAPFYDTLKQLSDRGVVLAITYHDNCIPPGFPFHLFDIQYSHREDVGIGQGIVLPMGIEDRVPVVKTFGLGRSRADIIGEICKKNGWKFEFSFGENEWLTSEELYRWLRESDLIVLYYGEAEAAGVSIAARVALSTRRPVIVNDTTWFKDLVAVQGAECPNLICVTDTESLEEMMQSELENQYIQDNSWDQIALWHLEDYINGVSHGSN